MTTQLSNVAGATPTTGAGTLVYICAGAPVAAVNDVQTITVDSCTHSTLTLSGLPGGRTYTAAIDIVPEDLEDALNTLFGTDGDVVVTGTYTAGAGGTYILTFGADLAGQPVGLIGVSALFVGGNSPAVAIVHTTPGIRATYSGAPPGTLLVDSTNGALYLNSGSALSPVWGSAIATGSGELTTFLAAIPTAAVTNLADPAALTAVPGTFADLPAVVTYLAGANVMPLIESRIENLEDKLNALLTALRGAAIIS